MSRKKDKKTDNDPLMDYLLGPGGIKAKAIMMDLDGEKYMRYYIQILEFYKAKMQRVEMDNKQDTLHRIVVNWDGNDRLLNQSPTAPHQPTKGIE